MDSIKKLVQNKNLKTKLWIRLAESGRKPFIQYDESTDQIMCSLVPFDIETTVHYIDSNFAFLYNNDKEIVGFQIEGFEKSFLPKHANIKKVWKLSDAIGDDKISNFGELTIEVQKLAPLFLRELMKTTNAPQIRELQRAFV